MVVSIIVWIGKTNPVIQDIRDELKGKYPKDFKFVGWHPQCRCYVTSILKTEKELEEDTEKILAGEKVSGESVNTVKDVPQGFKDWVDDNRERIEAAEERGTLPYFLKDNQAIVKPLIKSESLMQSELTAKRIKRTKCLISSQEKDLKDLGFDVHYIYDNDWDFDVISVVKDFKETLGDKFVKYLGTVNVYDDRLQLEFTCKTTGGEIICERLFTKSQHITNIWNSQNHCSIRDIVNHFSGRFMKHI